MQAKDTAPIPKQMTIVIGLCVVGLMAFGLAISYYKNILFDQQLISMQEHNDTLKKEIADGYVHLQYLKSEQYKDKYAKENFGLLRTGEKVLIFSQPPEAVPFITGTELTDDERAALYEERLRDIRIVDHWRIYLFHRDQIEELKKAT